MMDEPLGARGKEFSHYFGFFTHHACARSASAAVTGFLRARVGMSGFAGPPSFCGAFSLGRRGSSSSRGTNGVAFGADAIAFLIAAALQSGHDMRSFLCSQKGEPVTTTTLGARRDS